MTYVFNDKGRLVGVAFNARPDPFVQEYHFFNERGELVATVNRG